MAKTNEPVAGEVKAKKARAPAKAKTVYFVTEHKIEGSVHVVKNGEALVDLMDKANEAGKPLNYRKVTIPAGR